MVLMSPRLLTIMFSKVIDMFNSIRGEQFMIHQVFLQKELFQKLFEVSRAVFCTTFLSNRSVTPNVLTNFSADIWKANVITVVSS